MTRRWMAANESTEIPTNLLFVDTEAWIKRIDWDHTELNLRLWCAESVRLEGTAIRSREFYHGFKNEEFWQLVDERTQPKKPLWILAHNWKYDKTQLQLWNQFDEHRFCYVSRLESKRHSIMAIDGNPWFIKCQHKSGATVWFVDTMNYWHTSLEDLGDSIGLPKLQCEICDAMDDELKRYCFRDVEIISKAFTDLLILWQRRKLGNFRTSAAGLSMQNFRHWCVSTKAKIVDKKDRFNILTDPEAKEIEMERDGYFGGRIEAFFYGTFKGKCYHLDVKSMYPSVMQTGFFPIERIDWPVDPTIDGIKQLTPAYDCMAEVLINSCNDTYPLRKGGRQIHACGRFWTILCGREFQRAIRHNHVELVETAILYKTAPLFEQWVLHWFKMRLEFEKKQNWAGANLCKLILNSLHGKFGQRGVKWQDADVQLPFLPNGKRMRWGMFLDHDFESRQTTQCRALAGNVQIQVEGEPPQHCFPAISAIISANVREKLRDLIVICPTNSVLYTAVDSLIVTEAGFRALLLAGCLSDNSLGKLRCIGEHQECEIRSQGCYRLDDEWTVCGLWGKAEMDFDGKWTALDWRFDDLVNFDHDGTVYINRVNCNSPRANPKGELLEDGWVKPHCINKPKEFYDLPIMEQRKQIFEEK